MGTLEVIAGWLGQGDFRPVIVSRKLTPMIPAFRRVASRHGIPAPLLVGIAIRESALNPGALGPPIESQGGQRALGLMQITPTTANSLGLSASFLGGGWSDPETNIDAGALVLLDKGFGTESIRTVLARYGGFVTVDPSDYINFVLTWATVVAPRVLTVPV